MTAVLGILNKQAVAIAADSAVTVGGPENHKIFNRANKVFTLSKRHPVGIMLYNSASFMATPWEIIIKIYRNKLGERSFSTLKEYQTNFLKFLASKNYFTNEEMQRNYFTSFALNIVDSTIADIRKNNRILFEQPTEKNKQNIISQIEHQLISLKENWQSLNKICPEFDAYTFENFKNYSNVIFDQIIENRFTQNGFTLSDQIIELFKESIYYILKSKENISNHTGLVFAGFGEDEIFPQLIPINVSMVFDNKLRYFVDDQNCVSISDNNSGAVMPFAQTDVIHTILRGIDPDLNSTYLNNFGTLFDKYNELLLKTIGDSNPLLFDQIKAINTSKLIDEYALMNQQILRENYIIPLINAVSQLSKEDLAEMAESLIYLTYLKRRITNAEESVGGPVDVAIISKGDGFIWIKRKHYFKPELNQFFFDNYFKI
ncbi:MAG: hypothetical protein K9H26_06440 [Prolixibacteraceae bacterium]|nr:hypothetical protein [Prolixibacteraceae bacterium]